VCLGEGGGGLLAWILPVLLPKYIGRLTLWWLLSIRLLVSSCCSTTTRGHQQPYGEQPP